MGTTTPNIGIYIPAAGETNYDVAFAAGMTNLDQHDHSGAPNKGVPISTSGIAANSITYQLLNNNVIAPGGGLEFVVPTTQNQIQVAGVLKGIFGLSSNGFITRTGATTAATRTLTGTAGKITVTNGDGVAGNPVFTLDPTNFTLPTLVSPIIVNVPATGGNIAVGDFTCNQNHQTFVSVTNTTDGTDAASGYFIQGAGSQACSIFLFPPAYAVDPNLANRFAINCGGGTTTGMNFQCGASNDFHWYGSAATDLFAKLSGTQLIPGVDNTSDLGNGSFRWKEVFAANGTINTSDERQKVEISPLPYGLNMIEQLNPSIFRMKDGKRWHWGLVAQSVKNALDHFKTDCSVYVDPAVEDPESTGPLGLRYDQFIAICIKAIQELHAEVKALKGAV